MRKLFEDFFDDVELSSNDFGEESVQTESYTSYIEIILNNITAITKQHYLNINALNKLLYGISFNKMFGDDIQYEFTSTNIDNNIKFKQLDNHVLDILKNNIQMSNEHYMHFRVYFNEIHKTSFSNFVDTILNTCKWLCFSFSNHAAPPYRYTDIKWIMFVQAHYKTVNDEYTVKLLDNYDFKNTDIYKMVSEFSTMYEMIYKTHITKKDILDFAKKHNLKKYVSTLLVKSFVISEMPKTFHIQYFDKETINQRYVNVSANYYDFTKNPGILYSEITDVLEEAFNDGESYHLCAFNIHSTVRRIIVDKIPDDTVNYLVQFHQYNNTFVLDGCSINNLNKLFYQISASEVNIVIKSIADMVPGQQYKFYTDSSFSDYNFEIEDDKIEVKQFKTYIKIRTKKK